jgi:hypothetical protein
MAAKLSEEVYECLELFWRPPSKKAVEELQPQEGQVMVLEVDHGS